MVDDVEDNAVRVAEARATILSMELGSDCISGPSASIHDVVGPDHSHLSINHQSELELSILLPSN